MVTTAAFLAAIVVFLLATLPPAPVALSLDGVDPDLRRRTISGAYHIHSTRSDGSADKAQIAAAAARAGLGFAVFTDHGDGTRPPDPPSYIGSVLCLDAVEISTNGGHYVAIGLQGPAPYPLGGEAAAVVEDVARLGGLGIAAHPNHPRTELSWTDWTAPVDGIEWINADAEWRDEGRLALTRAMLDYLVRPAPAVASVFDRPERTLARWDAMSRTRRIVALGAADAHGGGSSGSRSTGEQGVAPGPSYEAIFRTLSNRLLLERPLSGDAPSDARLVVEAIRRGWVYSVLDAVSPDVILAAEASRFAVRSPLPEYAEVVTVGDTQVSRTEIRLPAAPGSPPVPWVMTNWAGQRPLPAVAVPPAPISTLPLSRGEWRVEKEEGSSGRIAAGRDDAMSLEFQLRPGARVNQYAALVADLPERESFAALTFHASATRPMRVSVQLRFPEEGRRWRKSVYLSPADRDVLVRLRDMAPAEPGSAAMPDPATARSILFVVDLVNARPGDEGAFTISGLRRVR